MKDSISEGASATLVPLTDAELNMTPAEWSEAFTEDPSCFRTYLLAAVERGRQAERAQRDTAWRLALGFSHYDAIDGLHFDCAECAPLRMLIEGNAPQAPTDSLLQVPLTTQETNQGAETRDTSNPEER